MGRPPCCDKMNVKRGPWTAEEDAKILAHVSNHGVGNWTLVPKKAGLNRCGKSCRLRWTNYLRPDLKHDGFTPQEEEIIINFHNAVGSRWSLIARQLPGRTDNDVKNYWNTKLKKKLLKMGIDPLTHKPLSQLLSDFGNITTSLLLPQPQQTSFNHNNNAHPWDSYYIPAATNVSQFTAPNDQFVLGDSVSYTDSNQTLEQYQAHCEVAATLRVQNVASSSCSEVYGNSAASSSASSFVDAILDHERQLCSQFPHLYLDTSFD